MSTTPFKGKPVNDFIMIPISDDMKDLKRKNHAQSTGLNLQAFMPSHEYSSGKKMHLYLNEFTHGESTAFRSSD